MLRHYCLFSGIGGFALGLRWAGGFETVGFCEIDPYCRRVLAKHWPGVPIHDNIRTLDPAAIGPVDIVTGGFPCKQTSVAAAIHGKRVGLDGQDSGLWWEYLRLVRAIRPAWVVVENPPGVNTWAGEITGGLASLGYRVARREFSAAGLGAPHARKRIVFISNRDGKGLAVAWPAGSSQIAALPWPAPSRDLWRTDQSGTLRMDDGLPDRMERIVSLGNAFMPQKAEAIGRAILEAEIAA